MPLIQKTAICIFLLLANVHYFVLGDGRISDQ